jgi:hypothetical protein
MTPFWIGLASYLGGWVLFVAVVSVHEDATDLTDLLTVASIGIMWPVLAVLGVVVLAAKGLTVLLRRMLGRPT